MMKIKKAKRLKQPALIALWGGSSSGKTYSALQLAKGLVEVGKKIGVIDTENRRSLLHEEPGFEWFHIDLQPKFTSERFIEAFSAFENDGDYGCIIIDSYSMAWDGDGGVLDQAETSTYGGLAKWSSPKIRHKRMVGALLRSPIHVIFCMRSRMGSEQIGRGKELKIYSTGLTPIVEKSFIYEMGVSILLGMDHKPMFAPTSENYYCSPAIPSVKAPTGIMDHIRPGEYLTERHGRIIRDWFNGVDADISENALRVASRGTNAFRGWWTGLTAEEKKCLKPKLDEFKSLSEQADSEEFEHSKVIKKELKEIETQQNDILCEGEHNPFLTKKAGDNDADGKPKSESRNSVDK